MSALLAFTATTPYAFLVVAIALVIVSCFGSTRTTAEQRPVDMQAEVHRLRSMIAGNANGYTPACDALQREADAIRRAGNDGRGMTYGTE